jgi:glycine/D-amino acid oxidase-like deaminating enzyme
MAAGGNGSTGRLPWSNPAPADVDVPASWQGAEPVPYWTETVSMPDPAPALQGRHSSDLLIIGGGFTGLWAAVHAKEQRPERNVVLLEAETCGHGGSGRNGGFCFSSLTHTPENGMARFPREMPEIERLGLENHAGLLNDVEARGIDCELERTGSLHVAVAPAQADEFPEKVELLRRLGHDARLLDRDETRAEVASPLYEGAVLQKTGIATLNPLKLVLGLREAALDLGVRLFEHTPASGIRDLGDALRVYAPRGRVEAGKVLLATNAFPPLIRQLRRYVVPVYDYALTTEPLSQPQLAAIRWNDRQPIEDAGNQFHYYRLTRDHRILWGGFGAVYGGRVDPVLEDREDMFQRLAHNFFLNFPQLAGIRFEHRWAGAIDTCSRFSVFFGSAFGGRLRYAAGYTGLGVGASRFGGRMALDLLDSRRSDASELEFVRKKPVPFPPEPLRRGVITFTMNRLGAADRAGGRQGVWLRVLDRLGLGFQS